VGISTLLQFTTNAPEIDHKPHLLCLQTIDIMTVHNSSSQTECRSQAAFAQQMIHCLLFFAPIHESSQQFPVVSYAMFTQCMHTVQACCRGVWCANITV